MDAKQAYKIWADQYDTNDNKTRDLEGRALRSVLAGVQFERCLEIGCGTGKNTEWLLQKGNSITAVDISEAMLAKAKAKISTDRVQFIQADIRTKWTFGKNPPYDVVTFSLVLEHIEDMGPIFREVSSLLSPGGQVYIGELHPFKQYSGTKARFETEDGVQIVQCFNHNISDFVQTAGKYGLKLVDLNEYFDNDERTGLPRILTILFRKD